MEIKFTLIESGGDDRIISIIRVNTHIASPTTLYGYERKRVHLFGCTGNNIMYRSGGVYTGTPETVLEIIIDCSAYTTVKGGGGRKRVGRGAD